jgi:hypothetical protein
MCQIHREVSSSDDFEDAGKRVAEMLFCQATFPHYLSMTPILSVYLSSFDSWPTSEHIITWHGINSETQHTSIFSYRLSLRCVVLLA